MMTSDEIKAAILAGAADPMWAGRAVSMVEATDGTGIDYDSQNLLDEMIASKAAHPQLGAFLATLPGFGSGDLAEAEKQLNFLTMQVRAVTRAN